MGLDGNFHDGRLKIQTCVGKVAFQPFSDLLTPSQTAVPTVLKIRAVCPQNKNCSPRTDRGQLRLHLHA